MKTVLTLKSLDGKCEKSLTKTFLTSSGSLIKIAGDFNLYTPT